MSITIEPVLGTVPPPVEMADGSVIIPVNQKPPVAPTPAKVMDFEPTPIAPIVVSTDLSNKEPVMSTQKLGEIALKVVITFVEAATAYWVVATNGAITHVAIAGAIGAGLSAAYNLLTHYLNS